MQNSMMEDGMADFFPRREADLLEWLKNFSTVLEANASAWNIPAEVASDLTAKVNAYETSYVAAKGENSTKALVLEKNEKKEEAKAAVRSVKNKYIDHNEAVSNPDRERLGLPIRDRNPSPARKPTSRPLLEVVPTNNRQHTVAAVNQATGKKVKPADAYGVRYGWEIREAAPAKAAALRRSVFRVKTTVDCDEEYRGMGLRSDIVKAIL